MRMGEGLDLLGSFLVVAEELNFRRASERLSLDQSALTRRIQKLEQMLGFALFERSTREVTLTQAGQSFYLENAGLVGRYMESVASAKRISKGILGRLRLAYMAFAAADLMPKAVARFKADHPDVDVALSYMRSQGQKMALANNEIDIGYLIGPFTHPDFRAIPLRSEPLYIVMPEDHPLCRLEKLMPADIAGHPMVLGDEAEWGEFRWRIFDLFETEGIKLEVVFEASITPALNGLVAAGLGLTIYPESMIGSIGRGLVARPIAHPLFRCQIDLVHRRANQSAQIKDFVRLAKLVA